MAAEATPPVAEEARANRVAAVSKTCRSPAAPVTSCQTNPKFPPGVTGLARQGMDRGWVLLGFWRSVIGE
jgi:hypothetical protein